MLVIKNYGRSFLCLVSDGAIYVIDKTMIVILSVPGSLVVRALACKFRYWGFEFCFGHLFDTSYSNKPFRKKL